MNFHTNENADIEALKKALGEPFMLEFTEYIRKVRNNLIFLGVLSTLIVYEHINIDSRSSLFGLQFQGWNMHLIHLVLFGLVTYFLVHFIWLAWDYFTEWKLRLTGTQTSYPGRAQPPEIDIANDLRQTTLYHWWLKYSRNITPLKEIISSIEKSVLRIKDDNAESSKLQEEQYIKIVENLSSINNNLKTFTTAIESKRIPASLEKFDNIFFHFQKSQGWRWAMIELYFPVWIGVFALSWLSTALWPDFEIIKIFSLILS